MVAVRVPSLRRVWFCNSKGLFESDASLLSKLCFSYDANFLIRDGSAEASFLASADLFL